MKLQTSDPHQITLKSFFKSQNRIIQIFYMLLFCICKVVTHFLRTDVTGYIRI